MSREQVSGNWVKVLSSEVKDTLILELMKNLSEVRNQRDVAIDRLKNISKQQTIDRKQTFLMMYPSAGGSHEVEKSTLSESNEKGIKNKV
jgi:hypothetical protein